MASMAGLRRRTSRSSAGGDGQVPLRRVQWVRVVVDERSARAEAVGMGHRFPATCHISMDTAAALVRRGVPVSVCDTAHREAPAR